MTKVFTATSDFLTSVKSLWKEALLLPEKYPTEIDLLVFTGGEDVSLDLYLDPNSIRTYEGLCHTNPDRDKKEIKILQDVFNKKLPVKRILAICRGMQFINVMLNGGLYADLESYGKRHAGYHKISHSTRHMLQFLEVVNSLHHQGLGGIGNYYTSPRVVEQFTWDILAVEPATKIPEIVLWRSSGGIEILGVQFHPEFWPDDMEEKGKVADVINKWATAGVSILK